MLDIAAIEKIDSQKIYQIYDKWPEFARNAFDGNDIDSDNDPINFVSYDQIDHILFAGMGGSGTLSDIFAAILSKTNLHVEVVKGYHLPKTVDSNTLVVTTSISGNTAETLDVLYSAAQQKCKLAAFSSGGKMSEFCSKNNILYNKINYIHSPRASFSIFLYSMLKALEPILPINKQDILESLDDLSRQNKIISSTNLTLDNPAISLAQWLKKIPLIYYPWGLQAAAIRFKNSLQENAKIHVIVEDVIEACHNGVVSWERESIVQPILIQGNDDHIKTKERWNILKKYFEHSGIKYRDVESINSNILSKLINLIYLFDYTSIYKAIMDGVDPSPIRSIDYIKSNL
jgi:glucose/mannose-6-phosphate isomerase